MATKTLILRPTRIANAASATLYPSSTTEANAYTLVNEVVADDDATYIAITTANSTIRFYFVYNKPDDLENITNIVVKSREKLESGTNTGLQGITIGSSNISTTLNGALNSTEYNDITISPASTDELANAIVQLNNITSDSNLYYSRGLSSGNKASPLRITQIYMEITYESKEVIKPEPSDIISMKKDNIWTIIDHTSIYHKINNSWILSDTSILQDNSKYITKEVE